ncbi:MAG: M24 family metallopeptidase, partial [Myxococcota bacterium]
KPMRGVGRAVERVAKAAGFGVIENLGSHGVGRALHEEPEAIPTHHDRHERRHFHRGMVITLEPFLTTGHPLVFGALDGWTLLNVPGSATVQYEHTLIVTGRRPIITTA